MVLRQADLQRWGEPVVTGEVAGVIFGVCLIGYGALYCYRPHWFSHGWFGESRVRLPSPKRNQSIGVVMIASGLVFLVIWTWLVLYAVGR